MKSCTVGFSEERRFPAFIREIMVVLCFFHWCFLIALRKLAAALFFSLRWLRISSPHMLQVPFKVHHFFQSRLQT